MNEEFEEFFELFAADKKNLEALLCAEEGRLEDTTEVLERIDVKDPEFAEKVFAYAVDQRVGKHLANAHEAWNVKDYAHAYDEISQAEKLHDDHIVLHEFRYSRELIDRTKSRIAIAYAHELHKKANKELQQGETDAAFKVIYALRLKMEAKELFNGSQTRESVTLPRRLEGYRDDFSDGHILQAYLHALNGQSESAAAQLAFANDINPRLEEKITAYAHYRNAKKLRKKANIALTNEEHQTAEDLMVQSRHFLEMGKQFDQSGDEFKISCETYAIISRARKREIVYTIRAYAQKKKRDPPSIPNNKPSGDSYLLN